ncbi:hypothetical protein [Bordetella petrii]|uniref:hypothetical protein n=1 Tax=Bordetella petrii TaxID=94624 RepID=UPI00048D5E1C|nr:hypothetical protein [Bordetella petrii]
MIRLGNLTIDQMEARSGAKWPAELKEYLAGRHQPEASNIAHGKWHCFDIPFQLVCGDIGTAQTVYDHLSPLSAEFKEPLQIGVQP